MRMELTSLLWSLDELGRDDVRADRKEALDRVHQSFIEIGTAIDDTSAWN